MKIDYLFSNNKRAGSKLISWAAKFEKTGLPENPSHIAVLMNDVWVIESTLSTGVRVAPYSEWLKINRQLYRIPCSEKTRKSVDVMSKALHFWNKKYDWIGIMYFIFAYVRLIVFGKKLPDWNPWQNKDKYFCTEYVGLLIGEDYSMKSPARLCADWLEDVSE